MLPPATFMQRVACQPYANLLSATPDWRRANNSRVTLTTTRLQPASPPMSAQSCMREHDDGPFYMHALAERTSVCFIWSERDSAKPVPLRVNAVKIASRSLFVSLLVE